MMSNNRALTAFACAAISLSTACIEATDGPRRTGGATCAERRFPRPSRVPSALASTAQGPRLARNRRIHSGRR